MIKLIAALGNPGNEYRDTRHNVGWMVSDHFTEYFSETWQKKYKGEYITFTTGGSKKFLIKPLTFMNKSGESVLGIMNFFKIQPDELLVIHDDLETDFGFGSLKKGGGLGGHNGLRSISQVLGTRDFYRLRVGISRPSRGDVSSWVLGKFNKDEAKDLPYILANASDLLEKAVDETPSSWPKSWNKVDLR